MLKFVWKESPRGRKEKKSQAERKNVVSHLTTSVVRRTMQEVTVSIPAD